MTLTRGANSQYPCPVCVVPKTSLLQVWNDYTIRTQEEAAAVLARSRACGTNKAAQERVLQSWGLRPVDVSSR